ncbi:MAG: transglycosylase domain-containing protein [Phycicoccus sp.]|nr:transglycosylase domain-containing protein [Phycicoccus sp.]
MESRTHGVARVLSLLGGFVVLSCVAGLLLAGLAIPAVGAAGSAAKGGVETFDNLQGDFNISPLAQGSKILDANGQTIANPYDENRIVVPLDQISPWMAKAQIAIEDSRFYTHGGFDLRGFSRALFGNLRGGEVQGGSTLTQQYVKITLQENALRRDDEEAARAATEVSYMRKLQELKYALDVEKNYTKDQILGGYLNLVYYGDQAYGVEAASENYFGISAKDLDLNQAALLAGIVQQPTAFNPVLHPEAAEGRRGEVLDRMVATGAATQEEADAAKAVPVADMIHKKPVQGVCQRSTQPYFCAYVLAWLKNSPQMAALGATPAEREKNINQGGLTIQTTLNPDVQQQTLANLLEAVPTENDQGLGGAATVIEPGTGKILAMAQTSAFANQQVNWNVDEIYGGGPYGFQFGSTAKMYALVTALERGVPVNSDIYAPMAGVGRPATFKRSLVHDDCGMDQDWKVQNDYTTGGEMSLRTATANSVNTAFAQLVLDLGACSVRDTMTKMGLHTSSGEPVEPVIAAITLGAATTTPMTLASSYATLAAQGTYCEPMPITSITTFDGKAIEFPDRTCSSVIDPDVANGVTELLQGVLTNGTAGGTYYGDLPAVGKTGTTDEHNQSWFVGYSMRASSAVWIGNVEPNEPDGSLKSLNGKCFGVYGCQGNVFGGTIAAPVWGKIMAAADYGLTWQDFPAPSARVLNGNLISVPNVVGMDPASALARLQAAGFRAVVDGSVDSSVRAGLIGAMTPRGQAVAGATIHLSTSTGRGPEPDPTPTPEASATTAPATG